MRLPTLVVALLLSTVPAAVLAPAAEAQIFDKLKDRAKEAVLGEDEEERKTQRSAAPAADDRITPERLDRIVVYFRTLAAEREVAAAAIAALKEAQLAYHQCLNEKLAGDIGWKELTRKEARVWSRVAVEDPAEFDRKAGAVAREKAAYAEPHCGEPPSPYVSPDHDPVRALQARPEKIALERSGLSERPHIERLALYCDPIARRAREGSYEEPLRRHDADSKRALDPYCEDLLAAASDAEVYTPLAARAVTPERFERYRRFSAATVEAWEESRREVVAEHARLRRLARQPVLGPFQFMECWQSWLRTPEGRRFDEEQERALDRDRYASDEAYARATVQIANRGMELRAEACGFQEPSAKETLQRRLTDLEQDGMEVAVRRQYRQKLDRLEAEAGLGEQPDEENGDRWWQTNRSGPGHAVRVVADQVREFCHEELEIPRTAEMWAGASVRRFEEGNFYVISLFVDGGEAGNYRSIATYDRHVLPELRAACPQLHRLHESVPERNELHGGVLDELERTPFPPPDPEEEARWQREREQAARTMPDATPDPPAAPDQPDAGALPELFRALADAPVAESPAAFQACMSDWMQSPAAMQAMRQDEDEMAMQVKVFVACGFPDEETKQDILEGLAEGGR